MRILILAFIVWPILAIGGSMLIGKIPHRADDDEDEAPGDVPFWSER